MKYEEFEQRILDLAARTTNPITPAFVGYRLGITIDEAESHLDRMAVKGHINLESDDDGHLFYEFPGLPRGIEPDIADSPRATDAPMVRYEPGVPVQVESRTRSDPLNSAVAGLLALFFPGAGQLYRGQFGRALMYFVLIPLGYMALIVPGLILHIKSIMEAARPREDEVRYVTLPPSSPAQVNVKIHLDSDDEDFSRRLERTVRKVEVESHEKS